MLTVVYDSNRATGISDGMVEGFVDDIIKFNKNKIITVSNESVINELRYRVCCDEISPEDIVFRFGDEEHCVNEYGVFIDPIPKDFGDWAFTRSIKLIKCAMKKRKVKETKCQL